MLILQPIPDYRIWGGDRLKEYWYTDIKKVGHLYSVLCKKNCSNIIMNQPYKGMTFYEYYTQILGHFLTSSYTSYPLTIALVEAKENLSIQVHPNNQMSCQLEGESIGKTESWYFIDGKKDSFIYNGTCCQNREELKTAIQNRKTEHVLEKTYVHAGEYAYISSGTLHAMAAGLFVYEIEYGSDFTYRIYDFDRLDEKGNTRELQIEKALQCVDIKLKAKISQYDKNKNEITEEKYTTKCLKEESVYINGSDTLECLTLLDGQISYDGHLVSKGMSLILEPGERLEGQKIKLAIVARLNR